MKISCESCGSKYQLDDSKVAGKTKKFGVKCPGCGAVIVVNPLDPGGADSGEEAAAPPPPPPPPPPSPPPPQEEEGIPEPPSADDPFGGIDFDKIGGQAASPPPQEEEAPEPPSADDPFAFGNVEMGGGGQAAPPPKQQAPSNDPFDFGNVDVGGGAEAPPPSGGAAEDPFDFGGGGGGAAPSSGGGYGNIDFGEGGEGDLDDLDRMDAEIEAQAASGAGDNFFGESSDASYRLKNARGQIAGPFTIEAVREFAMQDKFTGQEEISRNEGPWISTSIITEITDLRNVNLDALLADASAAAAPEMDGTITFTEEEFAAGPGTVAGAKKGLPKWALFAAIGVLVLAVAGGGGWYWWTQLREIPITELTDQKIADLVQSGHSAGGERAALSEQQLQLGEAILDRYAVEEFPDAESALLTAIQKNPGNTRAVAQLGRLQAEWAAVLGAADRAKRARQLSDLARNASPNSVEANLAGAAAALALRDFGKASEYAARAQQLSPKSVDAHVTLARVLVAQNGDAAQIQSALDTAFSLEPEDQVALLTQGAALERRKSYDEALARYDKAIASRPGNVWPRYRKARLLSDLKRYGEAKAAIAEALSAQALAKMPDLKAKALVMQAQIALATGQTEEAMQTVSTAEKTAPGRADVAVARGDGLYQMERYADALTEYNKAIKAQSDYALAHLRLGRTRLHLEDNAEAEKSLRKALELDPKNIEAHLLLGKALAKQERYDEAAAEFNAVIAEEPSNALAYAETGRMLAAKGENRAAADMFLKAINLDPENANVYLTVAKIFADMKRIDEAVEYTRKAVQLAPESIDAKNQLGRLYLEKGRHKEAREELLRVLEANPRNVQTLLDLARTERALKEFAAAKDHLIAAREVQISNPQVRYYLGRTYFDLSDYESASTELSRAVYHDAQNPLYFYWWGRSLWKQSKLPDAKQQLELALKLKGDYVDAHLLLGQVLQAQEAVNPAKEHFEAVLDVAPRNTEAMVSLGTIYKANLNQPKLALDLFTQVLRIEPRNALASYRICEIFLDARQPEKAVPRCEAAIKFDSSLCNAYADLGFAYIAANNRTRACSAWRGATRCKGIDEYRLQDVKDQLEIECQ